MSVDNRAHRKRLVSRRDALALLGCAGATTLLPHVGVPISGAAAADDANRHLQIAGQTAELELTIISEHTLRISVIPISKGGTIQSAPESLALVERNWPRASAKLTSPDTTRSIPWGDLTITVQPQPPLRIAVRGRRERIIPVLHISANDASVAFERGTAPIFGLGEGGPQFDRGGHEYLMRNGQGSALEVLGARMPIPWLVSANGWALFLHQPHGTFDLTGRQGRFTPVASESSLPLDFFLVTSESPADLLKEYSSLTGFPHLPPIWSFGYQQSHRTLSSREEILSEAKTFREKKLPCDTFIYLGTGFCPSGWNTGHGSFTFNERAFPDPDKMIKELHKDNFHVALHVVPKAKHLHGRVTDKPSAADDAEEIASYWATHRKVFQMGVDGWWPDEGDWFAPDERLLRNRMYWDGPIRERPNVRPYALHRNGYAGIQRYGWLWSGDVESTWQTLEAQIPVGINTGLSGIPFWGTDTGGFVTTPELTGELYVRWFQFSSFCPLFRSHGRTWKLRLPWGWNTGDYGPTEIQGYTGNAGLPAITELHNAQVEPICRKYLELRYQLLPYLYTAAKEASETGMPIMRALWLHYAEDPRSVECSSQYLWGRDILVAPVTAKGATRKRVYLPPGDWYDFWTREKIQGGGEANRPVDLGTLPLFVRAGAIIPLGPVKQHTLQESAEPLTFTVYSGANGAFDLYEDDGTSFDYTRGQFLRLRAVWNDAEKRFSLSSPDGPASLAGRQRKFRVQLVSSGGSKSVIFEGNLKTVQF